MNRTPTSTPPRAYELVRGHGGGALGSVAASRSPIDERALPLFAGDSLGDRLGRELCRRRAVPFKEVLESYEAFARLRKRVTAPRVADLCAGHGLVGVLYALFERRVERVVCVDKRRPASFDVVLDAAAAVGEWVRDKVEYDEARLRDAGGAVPRGTAVVALHACGIRTDACIDLALDAGGPVGLLPCCTSRARSGAPPVLVRELGPEVATDVHRTYRLTEAGYTVRWDAVPEEITARNRLLVAWPSRGR